MHIGEWYSKEICSNCWEPFHNELGSDYSTCRYCGATCRYIIPIKKVTIRFIRTSPWWRFWKIRGYYEGANDLSRDYLDWQRERLGSKGRSDYV